MVSEFYIAVVEGDAKAVSDFISKRSKTSKTSTGYVNLNEKDSRNNTPLYVAIKSRNVIIAKLLIEAGSDVNATNFNDETALHAAVNSQNVDILKLLSNSGADVSCNNLLGRSPLITAIESRNAEIVDLLVNSAGNVIAQNKTLLHHAARWANSTVVKILIDAGADVCEKNYQGNSPLHEAIFSENLGIFKVLIDAGADMNATNKNGCSPLYVAVRSKYINIVNYLLEAGAVVDPKNDHCKSPLHEAARLYNVNILKLLIGAGTTDVNLISFYNGNYNTPLHVAIKYKNFIHMQLLLDAGANPNLFDNKGKISLHLAVEKGVSISKLLQAGADVNAKDVNGRTPLHLIGLFQSNDTIKILLEAGADINERDNSGLSHFNVIVKKIQHDLLTNFYIGTDYVEWIEFVLECLNFNHISGEDKDAIAYLMNLSSDKFIVLKFCWKIILKHVSKLNKSKHYHKACMEELEKAKNTKLLNSWVTFFNVLVDDDLKLVKYAGNDDLINDFQKRNTDFSMYGSAMLNNVNN